MSIQNSRRNVTDEGYKSLLVLAVSAASSAHKAFDDVTIAAFSHANVASNTHSPDRVITAFKTIVDSDMKGIEVPFKKACLQCCALKIIVEDGIIKAPFQAELWDKIKGDLETPMVKLETKGLKGFKDTYSRAGKGTTSKNQYEVVTKDIAALMGKIAKIDSGNTKVAGILAKFNVLVGELDIEYKAVVELQSLAKAALTPDNGEEIKVASGF